MNQIRPTQMQAVRAHVRGGPEVLEYEPAPVPQPAADEVLVRVHAAGITFAELTWDESWTRDGHDRTPVIPSHEVSGTVVELGADAKSLLPGGVDVGSDVFGLIRFDRDGAAAEYVSVPAADLASKPTTVSHVVAAALPLAALTALQALVDHAQLQAGERVLVLGGAGGVGAFAVQLARHLGARVTATARDGDVAFVHELGAETVIDFETEDAAALSGFDVVINAVGGAAQESSYGMVRPGGQLVMLSVPPSVEKAMEHRINATFFVVAPDRTQLATIAVLVDAGALTVPIAARYPLAEGRRAYESGADSGRRPGKTVLVVL
jgi:NADPH:quinone reductase-like Zn-dependent oxidoreductase